MAKTATVISFVARSSGSGKTTLIEKIVPLLKASGLRVAVIKHASKGFDLDRPGKDSWRFQNAGADMVLLASPERMALMKKLDAALPLSELERMVPDADIIIEEGFKREGKNRIEVFRLGVSDEGPISLTDGSILALVSDKPYDVRMPRFDINDAEGVAEFILKNCGGKPA
ncbi:MAG TPA: molybdopterin-guanine dinucleotide biosynthesis protein B [Nitrospirota bacterium]